MYFINRHLLSTLVFTVLLIQSGISVCHAVPGGYPTSPEIHASIVNIVFERTHCSGTVIAPNVVMTSEHCPVQYGKPVVVAFIDGNQSTKTKDCNLRNIVDSAAVPSAFFADSPIQFADIFLLKLDGPLCDVVPATLQSEELQPGEVVFQAGHGPNKKYSYGVTTQMEARVIDPTISKYFVSAPEDRLKDWEDINSFMKDVAPGYTAALPMKSGNTICGGDSGGPVFKEVDGEMLVFGVVGVVIGNDKVGSLECNYGYVQFFAPIAPYVNWIKEKIKEWQTNLVVTDLK